MALARPIAQRVFDSQKTLAPKSRRRRTMAINVVVDISHHNGNVDLMKAKQDGIVGVIHKGTQGIGMFDNKYAPNRLAAQAAGLLWGAYHFGTKSDGAAQADFFLGQVKGDD